jgi:hypothetical protein
VIIILAAESLKRRIQSVADPKYNNIPLQQQFVTSVILNPTGYIPRRFTTCDTQTGARSSISPSKYDRAEQVMRKVSTNLNEDNNNYVNHYLNRGSAITRGSIVSNNKFDFSDPSIINNFEQMIPRNKNMPLVNGNFQKRFSMIQKSTRGSAFIENITKIPLNKEYHVNMERKIEHDNIEYKDSKNILTIGNIIHSYDMKEITNVYHHMNFLKRFELPDELKNNFNDKIMRETKKPNLERHKLRDITRNRSNTIVLNARKDRRK